MLYGPNNQGGRGKAVLMGFPRETPTSLSDSIGTNDALSASIEIALAESIGFQDSIAEKTLLLLEDSIGFDDSPVSIATKPLTLSDSVGFSESLLFALELALSESIGFQETSTADAILIGLLADSIGFQETSTALSILGITLHDSIGFREIPLARAAQRVVVFAADTGAATTYKFPFAITGVGTWRKTLYLTTSQGLYALDAETDDGAAVTWEFRSGFSDFGSNLMKRIPDVSVLAQGGTSATLILVTGIAAGKKEFNYQAPIWGEPPSFGYVIQAGRGPQSVHWQFGMTGVGRSSLSAIKPTIELLSSRR